MQGDEAAQRMLPPVYTLPQNNIPRPGSSPHSISRSTWNRLRNGD